MDDQKKKRFLWGVALAWPPFLIFIPALLNMFKGISEHKATGLGAVAGGFSEAFAGFGFLTVIVFEIGGIVLLVRSFSRENPGRSTVAVLTIGASGFMLLIQGLLVWLFFSLMRHMP
jgi:uncharacterized membrane protein